MSTTCPRCGMVSHNPMDAIEGYCGNCHEWTRRPMHFDRQGNPIPMERWGLLHDDEEYLRVGLDTYPPLEEVVADDGDVLSAPVATVSTVWLGINLSFFGDDPPIIFETMIFGGEWDQNITRYATEEQAQAGHAQTLEDLREGRTPWFVVGEMESTTNGESG